MTPEKKKKRTQKQGRWQGEALKIMSNSIQKFLSPGWNTLSQGEEIRDKEMSYKKRREIYICFRLNKNKNPSCEKDGLLLENVQLEGPGVLAQNTWI